MRKARESCFAFRPSTWPTSQHARGLDRLLPGFFGKPAYLRYPASSTSKPTAGALAACTPSGQPFARRTRTPPAPLGVLDGRTEIAFADITADADLAEDLLRYAFRAVLDERADDMAFFAERIDKEAVSRLEDFVKSSFARMEYTEAIES